MKRNTPTQWHLAMLKGARQYQSGRFDAAARAFAAATRIEPNQAEGWANLGAALAQLGQLRQAISSLESSLRMNPNLAPALLLLGDVYRLTGNRKGMIAAYERATALDRSPEALNKLACALRTVRKEENSETLYREALQKAPGFVTAKVNLATLQVELKRFDAALQQLRELQGQKLPPEEQEEVESTLIALEQFLAVHPALRRATETGDWTSLHEPLKKIPERWLRVDAEVLEGIRRYIESARQLPAHERVESPPLPQDWPLIEALFMIPYIESVEEYRGIRKELQKGARPAGELLESVNMESVVKAARNGFPELSDPVKAELRLRQWHALATRNLPGFMPGQFKITRNQTGSDPSKRRAGPHLVTGTLRAALDEIYQALPPGFHRGLVVLMAILDIHPYADGNGRIGLTALNRELEATGEIPPLFRRSVGFGEKMGVAIRETRKNKGDISKMVPVVEQAQRFARQFCKDLESSEKN